MADNTADLSHDFNAAASGPPDPPAAAASTTPEPLPEPTPPAPEMTAEAGISNDFGNAASGKPIGPNNLVTKADLTRLEESKPILETYDYNKDLKIGGRAEQFAHEGVEAAKRNQIAEINLKQNNIRNRLRAAKDRAREDFERSH